MKKKTSKLGELKKEFYFGTPEIECSEGKFNIISTLFRDLNKLGKSNIFIKNIKEVGGKLQIYYFGDSEKAVKLIKKCEEQSTTTCCFCGKKGELVHFQDRSFSVLCSSCKEGKKEVNSGPKRKASRNSKK